LNGPATAYVPARGLQYELYQSPLLPERSAPVDRLPWKANQIACLESVLDIGGPQRLVWVGAEGASLKTVEGPDQAIFGLRVVPGRFSTQLALVVLGDELLVNGVPALRLAMLGSQDAICVVHVGLMLYVTERFRPFVGVPSEDSDLVGQLCPACTIEIQAAPSTRVVTCRCGAVYHHETEESHPDRLPSERLNCLEMTKICLRCKQKLATEETLLWDPATL
jgi:hypothetical protein